ncbi:MAG: hypothetical protein M3P23_13800 [Actinomycetota bacterium]|nr:hypothetical protein [Actinomycetota bacterium]
MPAQVHDVATTSAQNIAQPSGGRAPQGVFPATSLLVQEVDARQTDADLGMATKPDQVRLLIGRAAAPAFERLGGV